MHCKPKRGKCTLFMKYQNEKEQHTPAMKNQNNSLQSIARQNKWILSHEIKIKHYEKIRQSKLNLS